MTRVLLVDDDADGRTLLTHILLRAEIETEAVRSAEEAVSMLDRYKYDAVIIDLILPGMDGLELLRNIRRNLHTSRVCCVALTAFHSTSIEKQALDMGFDAYFVKPIEPRTFAAELLALIERRRAN